MYRNILKDLLKLFIGLLFISEFHGDQSYNQPPPVCMQMIFSFYLKTKIQQQWFFERGNNTTIKLSFCIAV